VCLIAIHQSYHKVTGIYAGCPVPLTVAQTCCGPGASRYAAQVNVENLHLYYVTWSDKTGLITKFSVLGITCQWLKLHLPNFHTSYTNSLPSRPSTVEEFSNQVSCHFR